MAKKKEKKKAGRPYNFGHRLNESVIVSVGTQELKAIETLAQELDISASRVIYQIVFGISKPIKVKE
jgi:hypothetical protein